MRTLIINGSPKAKNGNTEIFINKFAKEMESPYEICYAAKEDSLQIANYMKEFDTVIVAMPLYVHAMPGIVMKIIESMEPALDAGKSIGFIVQSGFIESAQSKYLERYLSALTKNLNYTYLGTVIKGGAAGTYMMPEQMNKKLFKQLQILGEHFETNGSFHIEVIEELAKPNKLSKGKSRFLQFLTRLGLGDHMFWNMMLKKNNAQDKKFDKPFADKQVKAIQNKDFKVSLLFTLIGIMASIFAAIYQITMLTDSMKQLVISQIGSIEALVPIAAVQGALFTFIATFIGLKLARKVNLRLNFKFDKKALVLAITVGLVTALIITASDYFIFARYLPSITTTYAFSGTYLMSGILYGGVIEEILLRLLVMSLFVLTLWKLFAKTKRHMNIPNWIYITAIILATVLFAAGHIPATAQLIGLSTPILIRCFVLNGIGGIGFGYLYWKKGLAYSMYAHAATHIFMQVIFMPILF